MHESKLVKYFPMMLLLVAVCFILIPASSGKKDVNDFVTATWNTNGGKWDPVQDELSIPMIMQYKDDVDVLAIQEAGILPDNLRLSTPQSNVDIVRTTGTIQQNENKGIDEYDYNVAGKKMYIYRFDRVSYNIATGYPPPPSPNTKQNLVLVSKHKADKVVLIEHICRNSKRENINRPVLGIVIANSIFYSLHPEPCNKRNEAPSLINYIQAYMVAQHPSKTWIAMGDFNRIPSDLKESLDPIPTGMNRKVVTTGESTRTRELDYGVVGGPKTYYKSDDKFPTASLLLEKLQSTNPRLQNPSDHQPVIFKY